MAEEKSERGMKHDERRETPADTAGRDAPQRGAGRERGRDSGSEVAASEKE